MTFTYIDEPNEYWAQAEAGVLMRAIRENTHDFFEEYGHKIEDVQVQPLD